MKEMLKRRKTRMPRYSPHDRKKPENKEPNIVQKAKNLTKAAGKYAGSGFKNVSEEQQKERMEICKGCEFYKSDGNPTCGKCGCFLKAKVAWASESCPIGKWMSNFNRSTSSGCGSCGKKKT
tara:strand:- start:28 stop:393 length:366 start_codon:yes stop_codon:yes gene_type:complete